MVVEFEGLLLIQLTAKVLKFLLCPKIIRRANTWSQILREFAFTLQILFD